MAHLHIHPPSGYYLCKCWLLLAGWLRSVGAVAQTCTPAGSVTTLAPTTTPRLAVARQKARVESGASLGAAYPNPAQAEITIACRLAQEDQPAELRFTNLLTGRVVLVVPVEGVGTERSQRVALTSLPAGQYAYQLVVEGQLAASPQRLTVNP